MVVKVISVAATGLPPREVSTPSGIEKVYCIAYFNPLYLKMAVLPLMTGAISSPASVAAPLPAFILLSNVRMTEPLALTPVAFWAGLLLTSTGNASAAPVASASMNTSVSIVPSLVLSTPTFGEV